MMELFSLISNAAIISDYFLFQFYCIAAAVKKNIKMKDKVVA